MKSPELLKIVLVGPEQPRNVGAVVRVAANFGLKAITVVQAQEFPAEKLREIRIASAGATEVVNIQIAPALSDALKNTDLVFGTSGRNRDQRLPVVSSVQEAPISASGIIAVIFGRESQGLTAAELNLSHYVLKLPVSEIFPSMNLAHAVAVVLYQALHDKGATHRESEFNSANHGVSSDLQERWISKVTDDEWVAGQLRRMLHRTRPSDEEMALLFNLLKKQK